VSQSNSKVQREARLRWVPIAAMKVSPVAQREKINQARVDHIAANIDLEQIGTPTVCEHDGTFWIIDGMHRVEALKQIGWGDQQIQCWTYLDLTDDEMAEVFLKLNDTLAINAMDKFRVGVNAGREVECDIDRIVRAQNMAVSTSQTPGSIRAVGTLRNIYSRGGPKTLARTLRLVGDSYGDAGLESKVLDGISLVAQRFNGDLDDQRLVERLSGARGGVSGLLTLAGVTRKQTGASWGHCVADATVQTYNRGRGGKKLPDWWKADA
jgi:hypothetical protein